MEGAVNRYHKLGLQESLSRSCNYSSACRELALILKLSYSKFPKVLQSIVFQDVLTAFRLLPRMQTQSAISAANTLLQGVESALPKQKKTLAVTEFKHAMVAHKRGSKARHSEEDLVELPQDVLVHIFSFLDLQSLVSASQVCWSWNVASRDNHIWQLIYTRFFNTLHNFSKIDKLYGGLTEHEKCERSQESIACDNSLDWRTNFKKAYNGLSSKKLLTSSRGLCTHCHAIVWVTDMGNEATSRLKCRYHQIKPISTSQIVEYMDGDYASSDSDSDSDSYDEFSSKLWAYPKSGFSL
ncbi:hypothetical protein L1987_15477 [Smallanthus sonchifolius]|uniref:Uncharacterized protein n=1 Tax=Smallanthus sonchifolius TaxID=185202 RepID=A0ACB9J8A0_9ASTR|nr:hypothetical protein L1987_15477 [Smallanthus sonchifolius]